LGIGWIPGCYTVPIEFKYGEALFPDYTNAAAIPLTARDSQNDSLFEKQKNKNLHKRVLSPIVNDQGIDKIIHHIKLPIPSS
jgi:hypothetical protein